MTNREVITDLVRKYIAPNATRSGSEYLMMSCPIHETKDGKPFSVNIRTGYTKCYSCGYSNHLKFLLRDIKIPEWRSVPGPEKKEDLPKRTVDKQRSLKAPLTLPNSLLGIFDYCPTNLLKLGFAKEVLQKCEVGYDKRHHRVTYPIRDMYGNLLGIVGGATYDGQFPKYLWYKEDILRYFMGDTYPGIDYDKVYIKDFLWHLDKVDREEHKKLIVVEGFKAALWLIQNGFPNTVALQGSTLTRIQREALIEIDIPIVLMLDFDPAGVGKIEIDEKTGRKIKSGTLRISEYLRGSLLVKKVDWTGFPIGTQPDDLEPSEVSSLINTAVLAAYTLEGEKDVIKRHERRI